VAAFSVDVIDTSVPVVVLHRGGYGDVAIARTLGRLGVPLYLVAEEVSIPVWSSRYWTKRTRSDLSRSEEQAVARLLDVGARIRSIHGEPAILLTVADWVAVFIERNCALLEEQFVFPQPARPILQRLLDKWEMHRLAEEHRIPTPATVRPAALDDVDEFLEGTGFPIVMKAADRYTADPPSNRMIRSRRELMDEIDHRRGAASGLNMVLQEYIPGDVDTVWMCNGYFSADPAHTVIFPGKKLRQVSATGVACLAMSMPNETVATQTERLMKGVGYRGCVGIGYRYDRRDGMYKLLDVNARVSSVFRLFAATNEMDVVRVCYLDLTGQDVPVAALSPGRKWMLESDVMAAIRGLRSGRLSVADWVKSVRGVQEWHWFAADDPVPFFLWLRGGVSRAELRAVGRITKRAQTLTLGQRITGRRELLTSR
jgi:D-aspartate ligase